MAIDAYARRAASLRPSSLEVMDALYVLYRETRQGRGRRPRCWRRMLGQPELQAEPSKAKRVWFALGREPAATS